MIFWEWQCDGFSFLQSCLSGVTAGTCLPPHLILFIYKKKSIKIKILVKNILLFTKFKLIKHLKNQVLKATKAFSKYNYKSITIINLKFKV